MRSVATQFAALAVLLIVPIFTAGSAFAECSCKSGRWVTLGTKSANYSSESCRAMFDEAREFDNAKGMRYSNSRGQCSLCFGSNWQCKRKRVSLPKKKKTKIVAAPPAAPEKVNAAQLPIPGFSSTLTEQEDPKLLTVELCDGQRQFNLDVDPSCLLNKQEVNRATKGNPEISFETRLKSIVLASRE